MPATAYTTWAFTFRPTGGATVEDSSRMLRYLKKKQETGVLHAGFMVEEWIGDDEKSRHLHFGLQFTDGKYKVNLLSMMKVAYAPRVLTDAETFVFNRGVKIWYNDNWFDDYCVKNMDLSDPETIPQQCLWFKRWDLESFPTPDDVRSKRPINPWYDDRQKEYLERNLELPATEQSVLRFVDTLQFVDKSIVVIADRLILKRKCVALRFYINGDIPNGYGPRLSFDDDMLSKREKLIGKRSRDFIENRRSDSIFSEL